MKRIGWLLLFVFSVLFVAGDKNCSSAIASSNRPYCDQSTADTVVTHGKIYPAEETQFGAIRINFTVAGNWGFALLPTGKRADNARPWIMFAPTFMDSYPRQDIYEYMFSRLLANGFTICGIDVGDTWGAPESRKHYSEFHDFMVQRYGLDRKVCLMPQSRGGAMLYNWAAEHPRDVLCIAGIYPVCDITKSIERIAPLYGLTKEDLLSSLDQHNPIDRLRPLAEAKVAIMHIHGDEDKAVPIETNSLELARRYKALGGEAQIIIVSGKGHAEIPEIFDRDELVNFLLNQVRQY